METKTENRNKLILLIFLCIAIVLLLAVSTVILLLPLLEDPQPSQPAPTAPPRETLPPPPANPYDIWDFSLDRNGYVSCTGGSYRLGIDVSGFQGDIDWLQVRQAGVEYVIIRVGGRGWGESGTLYADSRAQEYYRGAKEAGLEVGAYFFSQATTVYEAVEEALFALTLTAGWDMELPLVFDWEYVSDTARTAHVDRDMLTRCTRAFCDTVELAGRQSMIYFNQNQGQNLLKLEELTQYPFWLAMYSNSCTYPYRVDFWQFTATETVPGIQTVVDMNLQFFYE